jgi:hypothetical protein
MENPTGRNWMDPLSPNCFSPVIAKEHPVSSNRKTSKVSKTFEVWNRSKREGQGLAGSEVVPKSGTAVLPSDQGQAGTLNTQASPSSSRPVMLRRSFQTSGLTYQLVLLPVWVALLQVGDELCPALVNGQTGKVAFGPSWSGG